MNILQRKIRLHPLMLTAALALVGLILMINPLRDWWTWRGLESDGQVRAARLTNADERTGRLGGGEYHVEYEVASYRFEQQVSPELYEEIHLKPEINVLMLPDSPETARIVGAKPQHAVGIIRGVLVMLLGVLLWLLWEWQMAVRRESHP
ncbi:MAG: hypothetical protein K8I82_29360 [Anaerolineae bacterium]|nr:hypothetical protein [Anaerolineae bacterium]